jgi:hypothetical protein
MIMDQRKTPSDIHLQWFGEGDKKPTIEELQDQLTEATKSIERLTAKNQELIAEKRKVRDGGDTKLSELEAKIDELTEGKAAAERLAKKAASDAEKAYKEINDKFVSRSQAYERLVRDEAIAKHIAEIGVKKEFLGAVSSLIKDRVQVDQETGQAFAVTKDKDGKETKKAVADYVKDWAGSDEGKAFVVAPSSSGAGSQGPGRGGAPGGPGTMKRSAFEALPAADQQKFAVGGGKLED